jgi:hypothetical protein
MDRFIQIRSSRFPVLPGEADELVNEGTWGKALAVYLQQQLADRGHDTPFVCCEDWGWWVELKSAPLVKGVCIYCDPETDEPRNYVCTDGATSLRKWSWKKFRSIDIQPAVTQVLEELKQIFAADPDVEIVGTTDEFPW